jgi:hypothetical protein
MKIYLPTVSLVIPTLCECGGKLGGDTFMPMITLDKFNCGETYSMQRDSWRLPDWDFYSITISWNRIRARLVVSQQKVEINTLRVVGGMTIELSPLYITSLEEIISEIVFLDTYCGISAAEVIEGAYLFPQENSVLFSEYANRFLNHELEVGKNAWIQARHVEEPDATAKLYQDFQKELYRRQQLPPHHYSVLQKTLNTEELVSLAENVTFAPVTPQVASIIGNFNAEFYTILKQKGEYYLLASYQTLSCLQILWISPEVYSQLNHRTAFEAD